MALSRFGWDSDQDLFDQMLQRSFVPLFGGERGSSGKDGVSRFYPKFDVIQKDDKSTVMVELPGLSKDKVNIAKERSFGSFSRILQVPEGTKPEDIKASMDHGLLKVELPNKISKDNSPKKITVS